MPLTATQRMARMRARQRAAGLTSLTLVVPVADAPAFVRLAARRRVLHEAGGRSQKVVRLPRRVAKLGTTSISPSDILAFRELLETTAVALAVRRMNAAAARRLRAEVDRERTLPIDADSTDFQRLHLLLAHTSGDEALQLLLRIALQLTDDRSAFAHARGTDRERVVARVKRLHAGIVEAVIGRDEALAVRRMRRYLSGLREWLQ